MDAVEKKDLSISERTLVPISLVLLVITAIASAIFSYTSVYSMVQENRSKIESVTTERASGDIRIYNQLNSLRDRVSDINGTVQNINGKIDILILKSEDKK